MSQQVEIGNGNNIFTSALNVLTGALTISGVTDFPLDAASLVSVYDVTTSSAFKMGPVLSFAWSYVAGLPVYVWTFGLPQLPGGAANSDTLKIFINIPENRANYTVLQKIASATV